jgi:PAS domain S-box-containing protein
VVDYAIFQLDPFGNVTTWNPGAERIKGYAPPEIVGRHFSAFYTPEDIELGVPTRALSEAAEHGRFEAEGWRLRKDGSRFWASVIIDRITDESGNIVGFAKVTRDVTDRTSSSTFRSNSPHLKSWKRLGNSAAGSRTTLTICS